ncbi:acyltransferase [Roseiconus nitratireducens]|uniref:Acyltransferase n=1 Tax=Roseiconus nitratireducens TaxID=2605748 RepID=A0A5M6D7W6_9BACT|nr:nitrilase family protein [Roseiconus nitratireducens]KAA5543648.1 acyltransferase [Roseiconus nitratireducens]
MEPIRAASIQFNHRPGDKAFNLGRIRAFAELASVQGVQLAVFPEMCVTGYWHVRKLDRDQIAALAEPIEGGPTTDRLLQIAQRLQITLGAGLIERAADDTFFNTYVVAMPDGRWARHRKLHCFISEHLASGSELTVFEIPQGARVGVLTCYDNNLVENVRMTALAGAEILLAPHQTGGCQTPSPRCMGRIDPMLWHQRREAPEPIEAEFRGPKGRGWLMRWLPSRAHDNGMFLVFSNGVGVDDDEVRTGNAMILDPYGEVLAETGKAEDDLVIADLDPSLIASSTGQRWLRSRRPELYGPLAVPTGREQDTRVVRFAKVPAESEP